MKGSLYIIRPGERPELLRQLEAPPDHVELHKLIGGYLEVVPFFHYWLGNKRCVAFCDEDGKNLGQAFNVMATGYWHAQFATSDVLVGNVVIVVGDDELLKAL